ERAPIRGEGRAHLVDERRGIFAPAEHREAMRVVDVFVDDGRGAALGERAAHFGDGFGGGHLVAAEGDQLHEQAPVHRLLLAFARSTMPWPCATTTRWRCARRV